MASIIIFVTEKKEKLAVVMVALVVRHINLLRRVLGLIPPEVKGKNVKSKYFRLWNIGHNKTALIYQVKSCTRDKSL